MWLSCAALFIAALLGVYYVIDHGEKPVTGTLTARTVAKLSADPTIITAADVDATPTEFQKARTFLGNDPMLLTSGITQTEFRATDDGIQVFVRPTDKGKLVAVDLRSNQLLDDYLKQFEKGFNMQRITALRAAATGFVKELANPDPDRTYLSQPGYYRNEFALNAMRRAFGFVAEGVAARQLCACIAEDASGTAWFIVPKTASLLEIRGRKLESLGVIFEGELTAEIAESESISTKAADVNSSINESETTETDADISEPDENSDDNPEDTPSLDGEKMDGDGMGDPKMGMEKSV